MSAGFTILLVLFSFRPDIPAFRLHLVKDSERRPN